MPWEVVLLGLPLRASLICMDHPHFTNLFFSICPGIIPWTVPTFSPQIHLHPSLMHPFHLIHGQTCALGPLGKSLSWRHRGYISQDIPIISLSCPYHIHIIPLSYPYHIPIISLSYSYSLSYISPVCLLDSASCASFSSDSSQSLSLWPWSGLKRAACVACLGMTVADRSPGDMEDISRYPYHIPVIHILHPVFWIHL